MSAMLRLCAVDELVPGQVTRVAGPSVPVPLSVMKVGDTIYCVDDTCSHETASLADGWLDGYDLECPLHESRFDIRSGRPDCPPARRTIRTHAVQVIDGMVCVAEAAVALPDEVAS